MIIDVSEWQGSIDWNKVRPNVDLVILRASHGNTKDSRFAANASECNRLGIPFGVYHYAEAVPAANQIKVFHNAAKAYNPRFWVLDIENSSLLYANGKQLPMAAGFTNNVKSMYKELRSRAGAEAKIVYYGGSSVFEPYGKLSSIPWDALWFANYSATTTPYATLNGKKIYCDLWQYASTGKVSGISTKVDCNRITGKGRTLEWFADMEFVEPATPEPVIDKNGDGKVVRIKPGTWNIRSGMGTEYASVGLFAQGGEEYEWLATAWNGWLAIPIRDGIGWISGTGAEVVAK